MNERLTEEVVASVGQRYGSFDVPRFSFVREVMMANPYECLVDRPGKILDCAEDTESNGDVSFGYVLTKSRGAWVLRLSMAGPYAVLLRLREGGAADVVIDDGDDVTEDERHLFACSPRRASPRSTGGRSSGRSR